MWHTRMSLLHFPDDNCTLKWRISDSDVLFQASNIHARTWSSCKPLLCLTHCVFFTKHTVTGSVFQSYSSLFPNQISCFMRRWIGEEGKSFHLGKGIGKHSLGIKVAG